MCEAGLDGTEDTSRNRTKYQRIQSSLTVMALRFKALTSMITALLVLLVGVSCAAELPTLSSKQLRALSDHRGISEFAIGTLPLNERFCIEDTARALVAVLKIHELQPSEETIDLARLYLKVIGELQDADGRFRFGYQSTSGRMDRIADGDNFTRVLWGLGHAAHHGVDDTMRASAATMFEKALPHLEHSSEHLMAQAYAIQGLTEYLRAKPHDAAADQALKLQCDAILKRLPEDQAWP